MRPISGKVERGARERAVSALAAQQHGVLTREQLLGLGASPEAIKRWLRAGRLHPLHRGVYLLGHSVLPPLAREMAAVLACGPHALLSHTSAAFLLKLLPPPGNSARVTVTTIGKAVSKRGIRTYRVPFVHPSERRIHKRIPHTSPARTLLDLAADQPPIELERMVAEAKHRNLVRDSQLRDVLERHPKRKGAANLRRLMAAGKPAFTRSEAERRMVALVRKACLPEPETNVIFGPYELDFYWREQRLVVEVDGFGSHSSRASFESDRRRDAELLADGIRTARVTWEHLCDEPDRVAYRLERSLSVRA